MTVGASILASFAIERKQARNPAIMFSLLKTILSRPVILLAGAVLGSSLAFLLYIALSITDLKDDLPLDVLNRQLALQTILGDFFELDRTVNEAAENPTPANLARIGSEVARVRANLERVVGAAVRAAASGADPTRAGVRAAAEIHALARPVLDDLRIWLERGILGLPPDSFVVLKAMELRTLHMPMSIQALLAKAQSEATATLNREVSNLERFRRSLLPIMIQILLVGALFTLYAVRAHRLAAANALERQRLRDAIEAIPVGFALFDREARLVLFNERHRNNFPGAKSHMVEGASFYDLVRTAAVSGNIQDAADHPDAWIERRLAAFHNPSGSIEVPLGDGRILEITGRRTADGGTVTITADISATRAREAELLQISGELREKNLLFDTAMDNMVVGLAMFDDENRLIICNRRYLELYDLPPEVGRQGTPIEEIMEANGRVEGLSPEETRRTVEARLAIAESPVELEDLEHLSSGRVIKRIHRPLLGGGSVAVYEEITARANAERALWAAKEEAEMANRSKSEFLANVSHELRTPLNAIIGFSDIIQAELFGPVKPAQYRIYARDIHDSGRHLLSLINDILDLSKIEAGKFEVAETDIDLADLVAGSLRLVHERARERRLHLVNALPRELPALMADPRAVKQILINLLSNAVKFTEVDGTVTVAAAIQPDGALHLSVIDTGIGMEPKDIVIALTPFGQVDSSLNRRFEGTGLGLPLCKRLAELHGGTLDVESAKEAGTCVTVRFPAERVHQVPVPGQARHAMPN